MTRNKILSFVGLIKCCLCHVTKQWQMRNEIMATSIMNHHFLSDKKSLIHPVQSIKHEHTTLIYQLINKPTFYFVFITPWLKASYLIFCQQLFSSWGANRKRMVACLLFFFFFQKQHSDKCCFLDVCDGDVGRCGMIKTRRSINRHNCSFFQSRAITDNYNWSRSKNDKKDKEKKACVQRLSWTSANRFCPCQSLIVLRSESLIYLDSVNTACLLAAQQSIHKWDTPLRRSVQTGDSKPLEKNHPPISSQEDVRVLSKHIMKSSRDSFQKTK